eukprot:263225_1
MAQQPTEELEQKYVPPPKHALQGHLKAARVSSKRLSLEGSLKAARVSLEQYVNPKRLNKDKLIPKKILKNAKGIVFLTCIKAGFLFAANVGTGCVILRNERRSSGWSPPSAIGVAGVSFGVLAGGAKVEYLFILNDDHAVKQFTGAGQLRLGGEMQLALGPIGRDADASVGVGDGGVSAIYSYSHSSGLYGGLELKGKIITVRPKTNAKFYGITKVKCADILSGFIDMPPNGDYARIVHLLNTYCLDHVFPQQIEETVDIAAMMALNDANIDNAVKTLHSMFVDVDVEVIRLVLMEQCWGDMNHATDVLLKMSTACTNKNRVEQKIEEYDEDVIKKDVDKKEIEEVAQNVKEAVFKQCAIQKIDALECYEVVSGRCVSRAVETYQVELKMTESNNVQKLIETVCDVKYRINVKVGKNRVCEVLVEKSNPPLKYELLNVDFGLEEHEEEEKQLMLEPFSSNRLRKLARSNTKKHLELSDLELSDEDLDLVKNELNQNASYHCPIVSTINANTMNENAVGNGAQTVALLDGLVKSFERQ